MPIDSREKGQRGERELAKWLMARGIEAKRGQQFAGGPDSPDVMHTIPGLHIECKRVEKLNLREAFEQATRDAGAELTPTVWHRKNRTPWLVTIEAGDFVALLKRAELV